MSMVRLLLSLLPPGAYSVEEDADHVLELTAQADALDEADGQLDHLEPELWPDGADETLADWERILGLVPASSATSDQRRAAVQAQWALQPDLTPGHIQEAVATASGANVTIIEFAQLWDEWLWDTIWVDDWLWLFFVSVDQAAIVSGSIKRAPLQLLVDALKPAHTRGTVVASEFVWDEPWGWDYSLWSS